MAKTKQCPFCGKTVTLPTLGLFGGDAATLNLGAELNLSVCQDCVGKYNDFLTQDAGRFGIKFKNMKLKTKKRYTEAELAQIFLGYYNESQEYKAKSNGSFLEPSMGEWYVCNDNGQFRILESQWHIHRPLAYLNNQLNGEADGLVAWSAYNFTKDDISMIEYNLMQEEDVSGIPAYKNVMVSVKLNDYAQMTYKPTYVFMVATIEYKGLFPSKKRVHDEVLQELMAFREAIGATYIPITEREKKLFQTAF